MQHEDFAELVKSIEEMKEIRRGNLQPGRVTQFREPDVAALRKAMDLTQEQLAAMLGISTRTVQDWEQGRRSPRGPARALLRVAEHSPRTVLEAMAGRRVKPAASAAAKRNSSRSGRTRPAKHRHRRD
jgi:putative transcriptional regulator